MIRNGSSIPAGMVSFCSAQLLDGCNKRVMLVPGRPNHEERLVVICFLCMLIMALFVGNTLWIMYHLRNHLQ